MVYDNRKCNVNKGSGSEVEVEGVAGVVDMINGANMGIKRIFRINSMDLCLITLGSEITSKNL